MAITCFQKLQGNRTKREEHEKVMNLLAIWGVLYGINNILIIA